MAHTSTGSFPITFRRARSEWQSDLPALARWARENGFPGMDLGPASPDEVRQVQAAGVRVGSVDLKQWPELASPDPGRRRDAVALNLDHVKSLAPLGVGIFFAVVVPEDHTRKRNENFSFAEEGYGEFCRAIEPLGLKLALEGWPGGPPHYSSLACTPSEYRMFLKTVGSAALGINFDPSHLIRMAIDPVRFLDEFGPRVFHVHAKDAEILADDLYEFGNLQPAAFGQPRRYGGHHWRYTIPGHGQARWKKLLSQLASLGYHGDVSIELEDDNFNGTPEGEQRGLLASQDYLKNV